MTASDIQARKARALPWTRWGQRPQTRIRSRAALLGATALTAALGHAAAQPAPSARPSGGQVTLGTATISNTASTTTINQSTNRAAINWQTFNVGSAQTVDFVQPGSTSVTLNRVVGPDPSAVAGRINANGQIIITNPSGVVFDKGAQVNAQSLVVSTAGITNANFAAGRLQLDQQGHAGAAITNAGTITVKQAGLAALVGPSVANSGVINAQLGHVVLAGAQAATLDMYGDGLVSIDVTAQVTQVRSGDGTATALVTNTGTILADGGAIQLTAAAADGVVQNLVDAGGRLQADTVGNQVGRVAITGTGGSVIVDGQVTADGTAPGQTGGQIQVAAAGSNTIAGTISASGQAGGGAIAIGTSLARPIGSGTFPTGTSARTTIAKTAHIAADATSRGNGGRVTLLSTRQTSIAGSLSARGGAAGGNGGTLELSGQSGFSLSGAADTSAASGRLGKIVIDPTDLTIIGEGTTDIALGGTAPNITYAELPAEATVTAGSLEQLSGDIELQAINNLVVASSLFLGNRNLTLEAGNNLTVNAGTTISLAGLLTLTAGATDAPPCPACTGALTIAGTLDTPGGVTLSAGSGGILIDGNIDIPTGETTANPLYVNSLGAITFQGATVNVPGARLLGGGATVVGTPPSLTGGDITESSDSVINAGLLQPVGSQIVLEGINAIGTLGDYFTPGSISFFDTPSLVVASASSSGGAASLRVGGDIDIQGPIVAGTNVSLTAGGNITQSVGIVNGMTFTGRIQAATLVGSAQNADLTSTGNVIATLGQFSTNGDFHLTDAASLTVAELDAPDVSLSVTGNLALAGDIETFGGPFNVVASGSIVQQSGFIIAGTLAGSAAGASFGGADNSIATLGTFASTGNFLLNDGTTVSVQGMVSAGTGDLLTLMDDSFDLTGGGALVAPNGIVALQEHTLGNGVALNATLVPNGSVAAPTLRVGSLTGGPVTITGRLNPSGVTVLDLLSQGAVTDTGDSAIDVATLEGHAGSASFAGPNAIRSLGSFTTTTGFDLTDLLSTTLTVNGPVTDGAHINLTSYGPIALAGNLQAPVIDIATVGAVDTGNPITQTAGLLSGTSVTLSADGDLLQRGGTIDATGTATLQSRGSLSIGGALDGADVTLVALKFPLPVQSPAGTLGSTGNQFLPGLILEPGGVITAGTLTGSSNTTADLGGGNVIANLGSFTSRGGFALTDTAALTLAGPLADPTSIALTTEALQFAGTVTTALLTLTSAGAVTQPAGALQLGTLTGSAAGLALGAAANTITTLGAFASSGNFLLEDAVPLAVAGLVSAATGDTLTLIDDQVDFVAGGTLAAPAGTVALEGYTPGTTIVLGNGGLSGNSPVIADTLRVIAPTTGGITIDGSFALTSVGTLDLRAGGALTETSGSALDVATLEGSTGSATLNAANLIATLGAFTTPGSFSLTDGQALSLAGPLSAGAATIAVTGNLGIAAGITTPGALTLGVSGNITQTAGDITAGTLTGSAAGASFGALGNTIATLGSFASTGDFLLNAGPSLSIAGPVSVADAGLLTLLTDAASFTPTGSISAPQGTIILAEHTPGAGLTVQDGTVPAGQIVADTLQLGTVTGGPLTLAGNFTLADVATLDLQSAGAVTETQGSTIDVATLAGTTGSADLGGANQIATLAGFTAAGSFSLTDAADLAVEGPLSAGAINLAITGNLLLAADVRATGSLALAATGDVTQQTGTLTAATLSGSAADAIFSIAAVQTLGSFAATGDFQLTDPMSLTVQGAVSATDLRLDVTGDLDVASGAVITGSRTGDPGMSNVDLRGTGNATVDGRLAGTGIVVNFADATAVTQGATLSASSFINLYAASTAIPGFPNAVADPAGGLRVLGTLAVGGQCGVSCSIFLSAGTGGITLGGPIDATGAILAVAATGTLSELGSGTIDASSLTGSAAAIALPSTTNAITSIGLTDGLTATAGDLSITDSTPLSIAGTVAAAAGGTLTLIDDSPTFATGGALNAAGGTVALQQYTTGAGIVLGDGGLSSSAPIVANTLQVGSSIGGPVTIAGSFALTDVPVLDLRSGGAITETAGSALDVATLQGTAGSVDLTGANQIATLGAFTTSGSFSLADTTGLTLGGPFAAGAATLSAAGNLALNAAVTVPGALSLAAGSGMITQAGGVLSVGTLSGSAASVLLGASGNAIARLADFTTAGAFTLTDSTALTLAGTVTSGSMALIAPAVTFTGSLTATDLNLAIANTAMQTAGLVSIGTLSGTAGDLQLGSAGTATIGMLAGFTATTDLQLVDADALTLSGTLAAPGLVISAVGALTLDNGALRAGSGGSLSVTPAAGGTASILQTGTTTFATLGSSPATLTLSLGNGGSITLANLQAPGQSVVFKTGTGGRVSGRVAAASVLVAGSGGAATLTGTIGSLTGSAAAAAAGITPTPTVAYLFDGCEIGVGCVTTLPGEPPVAPDLLAAITSLTERPDIPAQYLVLTDSELLDPLTLTLRSPDLFDSNDRDDAALLLPNISDRDY